MNRRSSAVRFVTSVGRRLFAVTKIASDRKVRATLSRTSHPQAALIGEVLSQLRQKLSPSDCGRVTSIENERRRLLDRHEPLIDGTLGDGGLYDKNTSVAEACRVSKRPRPALMLYLLTRALKPIRVIELGTNVGISSAFIAAALAANGPTGRLVTLDASPYRQRLAKESHANLGLRNITYVEGLFGDTLGNALADIGSVDLAFIDGDHQYQRTLDYLEAIFTFAARDAVFIFDDIRWSDGMNKAWIEIQSDKRFGVVVDLYSVGICLRTQEPDPGHVVLPVIHNVL